MSRLFTISFTYVYPLYLTKIEKKGRTKAELNEVIFWLTGFTSKDLQKHLKSRTV